MAARATRVVADPSIGVSDLEQVLCCFYDKGGRKANVFEYLSPPAGVHWKSSPHPGYLSRVSQLLVEYCKVAPNGVLPAKKHKQAIQNIDKQRLLNYTKKTSEDFSDTLDDWIRMCLSRCRSLRSCETKKARCFRRADTAQVAALEEILALITVVNEASGSSGSGSPCLALVPAAATPVATPPSSSPPSRHPSTADLDEEKMEPVKVHSPMPKKAGSASSSDLSPLPKSKGLFLQGLQGLLGSSTVDPAEQELLVELDKKAAKADEDAANPENETKKSKKAEAGEDAADPGEDEVKEGVEKEIGKPAAVGKKRSLADHEIDLPTLRKRLTSRAYHKAHLAATKEWKDDAEAKESAKLASAEASAQFEKDFKSKAV
eukprot:s2645_g7.t1